MAKRRYGTNTTRPRVMMGWREWVALPDLEVRQVKAKVDTGARSSALHAWHVEPFERDGAAWVRFEVHPIQRNSARVVRCSAPVADIRQVRNSGGQVERRYVIRTAVQLGPERWPIEISLTNRDEMGFRLLLGRAAVKRRCIINPGVSFLWGRPSDWTSK